MFHPTVDAAPARTTTRRTQKQTMNVNGKCMTQSELVRLTCSGPPWAPRWPRSWTWLSWWSPAGLWHDRARRGRASLWSGTAGSPGSHEPPSEKESHGVRHTERSSKQGGGQGGGRGLSRGKHRRGTECKLVLHCHCGGGFDQKGFERSSV